MKCTFIGHRDTPKSIEPILRTTIKNLIIENGVNEFYVGTHRTFDNVVLQLLKQLATELPEIKYNKVLAYLPTHKVDEEDYSNTIYPDGLEKIPPKFAIKKRNEYMIENSDFVVCYVTQNITNAVAFLKFAKRKGKIVINIANNDKLK